MPKTNVTICRMKNPPASKPAVKESRVGIGVGRGAAQDHEDQSLHNDEEHQVHQRGKDQWAEVLD